MIEFFSENEFQFQDSKAAGTWISGVITSEGFMEGDISYIFCSDDFLHGLNTEFLHHNTLTDIITFDYSLGKQLHAEIYVSTERVAENAKEWKDSFENELHRVLIHGVLHLMGYNDKSEKEKKVMQSKENECLARR